MLNKLTREMLIADMCSKVVSADALDEATVGTQFSFDILADKRASTALEVTKRVLSKVALVKFEEVIKCGPFEVVYQAKGAPCDLVIKDADGDHFTMPSGVLRMVNLCEKGVFPPKLPEVEGEEAPESPEEIIENLLKTLTKKAA